MIEAFLSAKVALLGVWFAILALAERLHPVAVAPIAGGRARLVRNLGLWAGNALINPLIILPVSVFAASIDVWTRPTAPAWVWLLVDLVVLDLWTYAWHRANHEWRPLWRFHRVHHLDRFLDATSAVRFHPGEVLVSALARAPLIVAADIPLTSVLAWDAMLVAAAVFHHSNMRLPPRLEALLRVVIVTPSHHWVHHHVARRDTNANYGSLFTIWDRLFRSWSPHARTPAMPIGAGDAPDLPLPRLVLAPFGPQPAS